jgi:GT2 family glycosyltransferase
VRVAVIIPTLDPDSAMIDACADAVGATTGTRPFVTCDPDKTGFARTCNDGAVVASDEMDPALLVFLNDDTIPQPGWLDALTAAAEQHDIVGAHLVYPDGGTQHSGVFLRREPDGTLTAYNRKRPAPSGEVPAVTGACLAIRRDVWDELGGFDESFVNGYEDVDLCLRARQAGHTVWFSAESNVVHLESQSDPALRFGHAQENIALLQQRWGHLPVG